MILSEGLLFTISIADTGALLFLLIYFIITLSDLECDYLNAQQCCEKLNQWVLPKIIAHVFLASLFLLHGHWILFLLNLPMAGWLAYELVRVPQGNMGVYDPTEIHNRGQLKKHMRDVMIYLGHYLLFFFVYLYWWKDQDNYMPMDIISDLLLFELCMIVTGIIFVMLIYCLLLLTDIECEEITPHEGCQKLNKVALIKVILHSILAVILFFTGHYWVTFMSLPMVVWLAKELYSVPRSHKGIYDSFEITETRIMSRHLKRCEAEMLYNLMFFFYFLYRFIGAHIDIKVPLPEEPHDHLFDEF